MNFENVYEVSFTDEYWYEEIDILFKEELKELLINKIQRILDAVTVMKENDSIFSVNVHSDFSVERVDGEVDTYNFDVCIEEPEAIDIIRIGVDGTDKIATLFVEVKKVLLPTQLILPN